ncbi:hypothetical protein R2R70_19115, partial [Cobetia sp. SIMBA_158]|uniref:DUF4309 domain-containing protein n=1 Tax=Cobetia sp. SIMBA_158 TaxID=3081617 RepID=UPI00397FA3B3
IKKIAGEPDDVRYYQDETYDQMILSYKINSTTEFLWVLPKSTKQEPDPKVDHVSLYTQIDAQTVVQSIVEEMSVEEKIGQMILALYRICQILLTTFCLVDTIYTYLRPKSKKHVY